MRLALALACALWTQAGAVVDQWRVLLEIDLPAAEPERVAEQIEDVIGIDASGAIAVSAKAGVGIHEVLGAIVHRLPAPKGDRAAPLKAMLVDSWYDPYLGVVILVRVMEGVLTIGAGGGSIAYVDSGGMLQVGPRSAGAQPGPACYGQGGTEATVTDANLVLGRLVADVSLAGDLQLDRELAIKAVAKIADQIGLSVEETALGIVSVANEHMARAIREISVNRGHDPADFMLASFGGAGGLHVCALAEAMHMRQAIVPNRGGVLSAMGMLVAPRGRQFARTVNRDSEAADSASLENEFRELAELGKLELLAEGLAAENLGYHRSADLRYKGQSYTLNVPWEDTQQAIDAFQAKHRQRYGYDMAVAVETAKQLPNFFTAIYEGDWAQAESVQKNISDLENKADAQKKELRKHLPKSLFLPVPRTDLLELLTMQDKIANRAKDISGRFLGRELTIPASIHEEFRAFVQRNIDATEQARLAINEFDELLETGFRGREVELVERIIRCMAANG